MKPNELKEIRNAMQARQKDLAKILGVPSRTYQNWEQPEGSREYRRIPDELADRVLCLAELKSDQGGTVYPTDLIWLQIPLRMTELEALKRKAINEDKSLLMLIRECIFDLI
ncbi:MAG: hypothetical protein KAI50_12230 [Desulfobacterales bacterium]|nr:hypothetical protein [Desulfobacterales bacterium]